MSPDVCARCDRCGQPTESVRIPGDPELLVICRTCERYWFEAAWVRWTWEPCVACGKPIISIPWVLNNHQCPPRTEAARQGVDNREDSPARSLTEAERLNQGLKMLEEEQEPCTE